MAHSNNQVQGTMCFTKTTLAAGTTTTLSSTTAATYTIKGKIYVQGAAWTNQATPTANADGSAFTAVPRGYGSVYVIGVDSAGNMLVQQGEVVPLAGTTVSTTTFTDAPEFPAIPDTMCPLGYMVLKIGSDLVAASWTFGASNLASLTGSTKTFVDCSTLPDRPQTS